jgi:hypothetical protein
MLCAAQLMATERGDTARAGRAGELIAQLVAALRGVHEATERVGLKFEEDETTPSGIRAWRTMADDHNSPTAWRAASRAFRELHRVHRAVARRFADELADLLENSDTREDHQ